jgi:hypothetical protein
VENASLISVDAHAKVYFVGIRVVVSINLELVHNIMGTLLHLIEEHDVRVCW